MSAIKITEVFKLLTPEEKEELVNSVLKDAKPETLCLKKGHSYKKVATIVGWFFTTDKMVCSRCGKVLRV